MYQEMNQFEIARVNALPDILEAFKEGHNFLEYFYVQIDRNGNSRVLFYDPSIKEFLKKITHEFTKGKHLEGRYNGRNLSIQAKVFQPDEIMDMFQDYIIAFSQNNRFIHDVKAEHDKQLNKLRRYIQDSFRGRLLNEANKRIGKTQVYSFEDVGSQFHDDERLTLEDIATTDTYFENDYEEETNIGYTAGQLYIEFILNNYENVLTDSQVDNIERTLDSLKHENYINETTGMIDKYSLRLMEIWTPSEYAEYMKCIDEGMSRKELERKRYSLCGNCARKIDNVRKRMQKAFVKKYPELAEYIEKKELYINEHEKVQRNDDAYYWLKLPLCVELMNENKNKIKENFTNIA